MVQDGSSTHRQSTTDSAAPSYALISPLRTKSIESNTKRREAAEWIKQLSGIDVPYSSDNYFRAALKDGVILCRILNSVVPGFVPKVRRPDDLLRKVRALLGRGYAELMIVMLLQSQLFDHVTHPQ